MAPNHTLNRRDGLLTAVAVFDHSHEWETAEPANAERAWFLCRVICERHGFASSEAILELV